MTRVIGREVGYFYGVRESGNLETCTRTLGEEKEEVDQLRSIQSSQSGLMTRGTRGTDPV